MHTIGWLVAVVVAAGTPKVGDIAPDFTAKDVEGHDISLSQLASQGPVLLAFFPKAFTPGCTKQLSAYATEFLIRARAAGAGATPRSWRYRWTI